MTRGQVQSLKPFEVPKVKLIKSLIEHLARNRGGDFLTPKLLLISTILAEFTWCMLILSLEINLGEIGVKVGKFEHGTAFD